MAERKKYACATFTYDGKRYYSYGADSREAQRKADKRLALMEAGVKETTSNMTVAKWSNQWLSSYKSGVVSDDWYNHMESIIRKVIVPSIGDVRIKDVKPMHIQAMYNGQLQMSDSHQKKVQLVTRQIFDSAVDNDLISKDPAKRIKVATNGNKRSESGYRTITNEERKLTLKTAEKHPELGRFFLIMLYCGCRPQEVARLKMSDYDAKERILHVSRAKKTDGTTGEPKSGAGVRGIPVPNKLAEALDALEKAPEELIVTSEQGRPLTDTSYRRLWKKFKRQMEIENGAELFRQQVIRPTLSEDFVPYCYRHTYCTDLQDAGVPVTVAQRLMGHSSVKVTADIYTHHSKESFEDARNKVNQYHKRKNGKKAVWRRLSCVQHLYNTCTTPTPLKTHH